MHILENEAIRLEIADIVLSTYENGKRKRP